MIKVVSFDIGGTLLRGEESKAYSIDALTNLLGLPKEDVKRAYKNVFQKSRGSFEELVSNFCNILGITPTNELNEFFINKFKETNEYVNEEDKALLRELRSRGYKVILLSNNCCLTDREFQKEMSNEVDGIFYSCDIGYTKSDKECYRFVENALGYEPEDFLHIGDTDSSS